MRYLIDGHNLIGQMPEISLADPDDEAQLVTRLRRWLRHPNRRGHRAVVLFDGGAPAGPSPELSGGGVEAIFAPVGQPADPLIVARLQRIRDRSGWLVVSSDRVILAAAARRGIRTQRAETFAAGLASAGEDAAQSDRSQAAPTESEVRAWLREFGAGD